MPRRITASTLALLTAVSAARTAQATNYPITDSGSKTVTSSATRSWSKNTKWGAFGAGYNLGYTLYSNYSGSDKYEKVEGDISGKLLGSSFEFVDVSLKAHSGQSSTLYGDYFVSAFGHTLVSLVNQNLASSGNSGLEFTLAEVEAGPVTYSASTSFGVDGISVENCVNAGADVDVSYAGIPLVFEAGASGCLGLEVTATASYSSATKKSSIDFTGKPYASLSVGVSAGVGNSFASVGAYGSLTLLELAIPITNTLSLTPTSTASSNTSGAMQYSTSGYLTLSSLGGEVGVYAKVGLIKYTYTLLDWDGITWSNTLLFTDSIPIAASPVLTIEGENAVASYTYADANPESGSTIRWERASDGAGTGAASIPSASGKTWELTSSDDNSYLRFCVTPSNGVNPGTEVCSAFTAVGRTVTYYWDHNYSGAALTVAYERSLSGTCFNMGELKAHWNDDATSYKFYATNGCTTTLHLYKDADCSGGEAIRTVSAGGSDPVPSIAGALTDSWNDALSSFSVVYCDSVSASDVSISFSNYWAQGNYTLDSASIFADEGSTYVWYRATDNAGAGSAQVSTGQDYALGADDNGKYLRFCVTPNNGTTTGAQVCSGWSRVAGVTFYWDTNYEGYNFTFPYKQSSSGTCFNMDSVKSNWNDDASSLKLVAPTNGSATITLYKDADCSGSSTSTTAPSTITASVSSFTNSYGNGWNDVVSSFKVSY